MTACPGRRIVSVWVIACPVPPVTSSLGLQRSKTSRIRSAPTFVHRGSYDSALVETPRLRMSCIGILKRSSTIGRRTAIGKDKHAANTPQVSVCASISGCLILWIRGRATLVRSWLGAAPGGYERQLPTMTTKTSAPPLDSQTGCPGNAQRRASQVTSMQSISCSVYQAS